MMVIEQKETVKNVTINLVNVTKNYIVYGKDDELVKGKIYLNKKLFTDLDKGLVKKVPSSITINIEEE